MLDPKENEKQIAEVVGKYKGKEVNIVPRIVFPQGISTPDYLIDGKKFDLKSPKGSGKSALYDMLHKKKNQADNFIFDISNCGLTVEEAKKQIEGIYKSSHTKFVEEIILVKDGKVIKEYRK